MRELVQIVRDVRSQAGVFLQLETAFVSIAGVSYCEQSALVAQCAVERCLNQVPLFLHIYVSEFVAGALHHDDQFRHALQ
jgi:hypothetical protein